MSTLEWVLVVVAAVVAPVNWLSVRSDGDLVRRMTKPAVLGLLIVAAIVAPADDGTVQILVVLALVASLAGDVALINEDYFIVGLGCFLLAHVLYTAAVLTEPETTPWRAAIGVVLAVAVLVTMGYQVDRKVRDQAPALRYGVRGYIVVILTMLVVAWSAGPLLMAIGAAFFVASDSFLGWNRFVREDQRLQLAVMPTYHVGQLLMMLALLHHLD